MNDIFDLSQHICSKCYPDIIGRFRKAKIFTFDDDVVLLNYSPTNPDEFFLPYSSTAFILSQKHMVLVSDMQSNQIGMSEYRHIATFENTGKPDPFDRNLLKADRKYDVLSATFGRFKLTDNSLDQMDFFSDKAFLANKYGLISQITPSNNNNLEGNANNYQLFSVIYDSIPYIIRMIKTINSPECFILEKSRHKPVIKRKNKKQANLRSRAERPEYTVLRPREIREKMGLPTPRLSGGKKRPHERRRHEAFLSNEKYRYDKRGRLIEKKIIPYGPRKGESYYKKIIVPAVWIGEKENVVGNHRYRVILDK